MGVIRVLGPLAVAATILVALSSCGPRHLSALGNPGDFCTEASSCTDGTTCRPTDDGFRCLGNDEAEASRSKARSPVEPARLPIIEDDDENLQPAPPTAGGGGEQDTGSFDFSGDEEDDGGDEGDEDGYVPPSRRRHGGG